MLRSSREVDAQASLQLIAYPSEGATPMPSRISISVCLYSTVIGVSLEGKSPCCDPLIMIINRSFPLSN